MAPDCRGKKRIGERASRLHPLGAAVLISTLGHLLLMPGRLIPTPPTEVAMAPIDVGMVIRPISISAKVSMAPNRPSNTPASAVRPPPAPASQLSPSSQVELSFLPPSSLDHPALPKSGPAIEALDDIPTSGMTIRMRLYIDEAGVVQRVAPFAFGPDDEAAVLQLQQVFMSTTFLAGQRQGKYVRSYLDIEITPNPLN